jgi:choline-glycine betaine transporter
VASQKFTWPGVTGVAPEVTIAVSVTTLPEATVVTALPPDVTVMVVFVGAADWAEDALQAADNIIPRTTHTTGNEPPFRRVRKTREEGTA